MKTIERNYAKRPHTARWLMAFHTGISASRPEVTGDGAVDLLDEVDVDKVADLRSEAQTRFMETLIGQVAALSTEDGEKARTYTDGMTEHGKWTPGREGNASKWITNLIARRDALQAEARKAPAAPQPIEAPEIEIPANYYGINHDGEVKCYQVDYGKEDTRWAGFLFLSRVSSDDRIAIKNPGEKARILAAIREDVEAAQILAGLTMRRCRRCGRGLSDTKNPYFEVALGPECGSK